MKISSHIALNATDSELGELMALCVLSKEVVTFESEVEVLERLFDVFAKGSAIRAINLPIDEFLLLAESVDMLEYPNINDSNATVRALKEFLFIHEN